MTLNQMLRAAKKSFKAQAEIKDCLYGSLVVKADDAVLHCTGDVRKDLDDGKELIVIVPPFIDIEDAVTVGVGCIRSTNFALIRYTNIKHA